MNAQATRPKSIFWPLVAIAAGVVWLLINLNVIAGVNVLALARLWPVVLIAAGLDVLLGRRPWIGALIALVTVGGLTAAVIFAAPLGLARLSDWRWGALQPALTGSGTLATETRAVDGFDEVAFATVGELTIVQGEAEGLVIEADDNLLPYLTSEVRGGKLYLRAEKDGQPVLVNSTRGIRYTLTVRDLTALEHTGAGVVTVTRLNTPALQATLSGAGNLTLNGLKTEALTVRLSGAGTLEASGEAARQEMRLSGVGEYDAAELKSATAEVIVSGAGSATVWVTETLEARISGAGNVRYYGDPKVDENISGLGSLQALGDAAP